MTLGLGFVSFLGGGDLVTYGLGLWSRIWWFSVSILTSFHLDPWLGLGLDLGLTSVPIRAVPGPVWSQCLILNQFFTFWRPKNQLLGRKTGSRIASTLCWSRTKNRLGQGLGKDYREQQDQQKLYDCYLNKPKNRPRVASSRANSKKKWEKNKASVWRWKC